MEKAFIDIHPFPGAHVHVIGIGGASMSGLARILRERGYTVSGSDRVENEAVQALRADGFHVAVGHRAENVRGADLVVYSSAIPADHVEQLACVQERIPCMERSELLGRISEGYGQTVCICGRSFAFEPHTAIFISFSKNCTRVKSLSEIQPKS